jgi:hypothetical protein
VQANQVDSGLNAAGTHNTITMANQGQMLGPDLEFYDDTLSGFNALRLLNGFLRVTWPLLRTILANRNL